MMISSEYLDLILRSLSKEFSIDGGAGTRLGLVSRGLDAVNEGKFFAVGMCVVDVGLVVDSKSSRREVGWVFWKWGTPRSKLGSDLDGLSDVFRYFSGEKELKCLLFHNPEGSVSLGRFVWRLVFCDSRRMKCIDVWHLWLMAPGVREVEWYGEDIGELIPFADKDFLA